MKSVIVFRLILINLLSLLIGTRTLLAQEDKPPPKLFSTKADSANIIVVCPKDFQPSLQRWQKHRIGQGATIRVIAPAEGLSKIQLQIRQLAQQEKPTHLFLIGDSDQKRSVGNAGAGEPPGLMGANNKAPENTIPMHYIDAVVNVQFGSEPKIPTDNPYADLDGDRIPDLAVGRLPASSAREVADYLDRVIVYETRQIGDPYWRKRINFIAGVGGFGKLIDNTIEHVTKEFITGLIPPEYETTMTLGSWSSPFCPPPDKFSQTVVDRFNQGSLFWIYIGHGQAEELDYLQLPDQQLPIMNQEAMQKVSCQHGSPIAIFLACYTGAIDHRKDSVTEVLLRQPSGPIAVFSGTRVTMPYGMSRLMLEAADQYFNHQAKTVAEMFMEAKRSLMANQPRKARPKDRESEPEKNGLQNPVNKFAQLRELIEGMAKALSPKPDLLEAECLEHVQMMHLYGDPSIQLAYPQRIQLETVPTVEAGKILLVNGVAPESGELCIELVYPRDRFRHRPRHRPEYDNNAEVFQRFQASYDLANNQTCAQCIAMTQPGAFQLKLDVPADARGECVVRCYLHSKNGFAIGSANVAVAGKASEN